MSDWFTVNTATFPLLLIVSMIVASHMPWLTVDTSFPEIKSKIKTVLSLKEPKEQRKPHPLFF